MYDVFHPQSPEEVRKAYVEKHSLSDRRLLGFMTTCGASRIGRETDGELQVTLDKRTKARILDFVVGKKASAFARDGDKLVFL